MGGGSGTQKVQWFVYQTRTQSIFLSVNFLFSHYEIQVRGVDAPPPPQETLSCEAKLCARGWTGGTNRLPDHPLTIS